MKTKFWIPFFLNIGLNLLAGHAYTQKIPITSCTSSPASVVGHECEKAYDGNTGTYWTRPQALQTELRFNFGNVRRIKYIKVSFTGSSIGPRNYTIIDKLGAYVDISVLNTNVLEDQITLAWGADAGVYAIDTVPDASALIIRSYSAQIYSIKEVEIYGPGIYTEEGIQTVVVPIPAWNMSAPGEALKCIDLPAGIQPLRVIGISATIRSDFNTATNEYTMHNFSKLRTPGAPGFFVAIDQDGSGGRPPGGGGNVGITNKAPCTLAPNNRWPATGQWRIFLAQNPNGIYASGSTGTPAAFDKFKDGQLISQSTFAQSTWFSSLSTNPRGFVKIQYLTFNPDFQ